MRHLKRYKIFESGNKIDTESIKSNINDIFQDLIDLNYKIELELESHDFSSFDIERDSYRFVFKLEKKNDSRNDTIDFQVSEIKEYILRMKDYLISEGIWNEDLYIFVLPKIFKSFYEFENIDTDREIYIFNLDFWIHI